ncbi:unnamed protein product [Enterobius vermicularis]|uniref:Uncharacterized protein n=1 Tax=Enterobius vermicularis TaxID=51028 RepID=A0A0N4VET6_ENTVE|nr:unnamed protein product [Enterobius vermicularis]
MVYHTIIQIAILSVAIYGAHAFYVGGNNQCCCCCCPQQTGGIGFNNCNNCGSGGRCCCCCCPSGGIGGFGGIGGLCSSSFSLLGPLVCVPQQGRGLGLGTLGLGGFGLGGLGLGSLLGLGGLTGLGTLGNAIPVINQTSSLAGLGLGFGGIPCTGPHAVVVVARAGGNTLVVDEKSSFFFKVTGTLQLT